MSFLKRFQTSLESLHQPADNANYVIAYSGGVDSHVLLHCCHRMDIPVRAVHVHHGLQGMADDWVAHCRDTCEALNIALEVVYVDASKKQGQSPEQAARNVRYQALQMNLQQGDCLLTAQHLNDQAETLLLQLFRTAGSAGLASMPACKRLGENMHLRPLLSFSRQQIESYATENALRWIEDPSNQDVKFDRNFIRRKLVPVLQNRWPEMAEQLSTVAELQSNNLQVLEDMAAVDLANTASLPPCHVGTRVFDVVSTLSIARLKQLSSARLLNVLRYWVKQTITNRSATALTSSASPTRNLLEEIEKTLINSQQDANPAIVFSGFEFRKYQDDLYLLKSKSLAAESPQSDPEDLDWNPSEVLSLPIIARRLRSLDSVGEGLKRHLLDEKLKVSFRRGGEQFHPVGRQHSQSLKKLLQAANVPPWERDLIPLLYWGDELVAVVGLWVAKDFAVGEGESGWIVGVDCL